ncbi:hypothetical protein C7999DRAFT_42898 [Corynascus novoguineensis]|uniref:non-specific serine/threonine protein kinase n=1 Tax=Corynascus novoguineensis TaxID=1126955 RepID=A0AAN7HL64_9PEZI|nr:hypothetical protein C7999DRAFT_42898 [Corynascus novoguineensis]
MLSVITEQSRSEIIKQNPIGNGFEGFRALYRSVCNSKSIPCTFDALGQLDLEDSLRASRLLRSRGSGKNLFSDLSRLNSAVNSDDFDLDRIKPLLNASLADHLDDTLIWDRVYDAQTLWLRNTGSFANSSEHRKYVDNVLKEELGPIYVDLGGFYKTYFGSILNLGTVSKKFFEECLEGKAKQDDVLSWFTDFTEKLAAFVESNSALVYIRRPLAKPDKPIDGSVRKRKMDIGFVNNPGAKKDSSELKSNLSADIPSEAWLDLGRLREEELRFDPTIMTAKGQRFIEIERDSTTKWLILDRVINRGLFIVKDLWQYLERDDEGRLLREATSKGTVHMARYYYHETIQVRDIVDNVRNNVRKGLDIMKATNYYAKWPSHKTNAPLPPNKRPRSASPTKTSANTLPNQVYRRVILRDYRIPIYKAGSRGALLGALADCIKGYKSLRRKARLLHKDISLNNLMIDKDNRGFLIDLDLAINEQRVGTSGAKGKTGIWAFIAVGALQGEQHSFMHDLESFFWVLFWICIHFDGPKKDRVVPRFDKWDYVDTDERTEDLARIKLIVVSKEEIFMKTTTNYFTQYYQPLAPLMNSLRKVVFPGDKPWKREDERLYSRMGEILRKERKDLK